MNRSVSHALRVARPVVTGLMVLNLLYALGIVALLVFSTTRPDWPEYLGFFGDNPHPDLPQGLRGIMVLGVMGAVLVHLVLQRLRAIVGTVRDGDPFNMENAKRLTFIAWCIVAGQGVQYAVAKISLSVSSPTMLLTFGDSFSIAPWLSVLLLYVLAGVFAEGARMRADLEGTV